MLSRFGSVVDNWFGIMQRTKKLTAFTASYSQASVIFPYVLVAPAYFADKIQLGGMMQTASAFSSVQDALSFFISVLPHAGRMAIAWSPASDGFETAIANAAALASSADIIHVVLIDRQRPRSTCEQLLVSLPNGSPLVSAGRLQPSRQRTHPAHRPVRLRQIDLVPRHRRHLAVRDGHDRDPREGRSLMMLPQRPYFPVGSLTGRGRLSRGSERIRSGSGQGRL